jgi:predicted ester cyclase
MSPDCVTHYEHVDLKGPEEWEKKFLNVFFHAIPDVRTELNGIIADDDTIAVKWSAQGNFLKDFFGIQPTGKKFEYSGMSWIKYQDGKSMESWNNWNISFLFRQLLSEIKTLRGLIPICAKCKKIRDDQGYWNQIESYIQQHSEAQFSHGMCEECSDKLYGNEEWYIEMKKKKGPE